MSDVDLDRKALASVVQTGDLRNLSEGERVELLARVCQTLGLDPITAPFSFVNIGGSVQLYARRAATDQLAKMHSLTREVTDGPRFVAMDKQSIAFAQCKLTLPSGRFETATGTVLVRPQNVGDALMTAETKAKRRGTLAILGLSVLDELEVDSIPEAEPVEVRAIRERAVTEVKDELSAARLWLDTRVARATMTKTQQGRVWKVIVEASKGSHEGVKAAVETLGKKG